MRLRGVDRGGASPDQTKPTHPHEQPFHLQGRDRLQLLQVAHRKRGHTYAQSGPKASAYLLAVSVAFGVSAPVAPAATAPSETITMTWQTLYVNGAPWVGTGSGTFSASGSSINDSGLLLVPFRLGGSGSPTNSAQSVHSDRTLTGTLG